MQDLTRYTTATAARQNRVVFPMIRVKTLLKNVKCIFLTSIIHFVLNIICLTVRLFGQAHHIISYTPVKVYHFCNKTKCRCFN